MTTTTEHFTAVAMCPKCADVDVHWMTPPVYPDAQTQNPGLPWQTTTYTKPYEHADATVARECRTCKHRWGQA